MKPYTPKNNLSGRSFGQLHVETTDPRPNRRYHYLCSCECGNLRSVRNDNLLLHNTTSCGCQRKEKHSRVHSSIGQSYGNYTVLAIIKTPTGHSRYLCQLPNGETREVSRQTLATAKKIFSQTS